MASDTIRLGNIKLGRVGSISKALGITSKEVQETGRQILNQHGSNLRTLMEELRLQPKDFKVFKEGEKGKDSFGAGEVIARIWRKKGRKEITIKEAVGTFIIIRTSEFHRGGKPVSLLIP